MAGCRMITRNEVDRVLTLATPTLRLFVLVGLTYGTRVSEALDMTFGDIDSEWVRIKGLKGGKTQNYEVTAEVKEACDLLKKSLGEVDRFTPLFTGRNSTSKPMTRQNLSQQLKKLFKAAGLDGKVNSHSLRKAFVTEIYNRTGKDLAQTKIYSRHRTLTSLQYYIETSTDTKLVKDLAWT